MKEWAARQEGRATWRERKRNGWTKEDFERAWEEQGGRCAICTCAMQLRRGDGAWNDQACADHDHATGQRRALLCFGCNRALGQYEAKRAGIDAYLKRFGGGS